MSYDDNGNILSLNRSVDGVATDGLVYSYSTTSNKLARVEDNTNNTALFTNANTGSDDYAYDANGNSLNGHIESYQYASFWVE